MHKLKKKSRNQSSISIYKKYSAITANIIIIPVGIIHYKQISVDLPSAPVFPRRGPGQHFNISVDAHTRIHVSVPSQRSLLSQE